MVPSSSPSFRMTSPSGRMTLPSGRMTLPSGRMPSRFRTGHRPFRGARAVLTLWAMLLALLSSGCGEAPLPEGVVATVNDRPITLRTLEAVHDMSSMSWSGHAPSVEQLQAQYGGGLSDLMG